MWKLSKEKYVIDKWNCENFKYLKPKYIPLYPQKLIIWLIPRYGKRRKSLKRSRDWRWSWKTNRIWFLYNSILNTGDTIFLEYQHDGQRGG